MVFQKGYKPWNAGTSKTKVTFKCLNCGKEKTKYRHSRKEVKYCDNKCAHEHMDWDKINSVKKGQIPWNKGLKTGPLTKEHIRKCLKRNPKSKLEIKFEEIINKLNLPYKFVGDGEFFVERKCPDFINSNGKRIAIEVFYTRHKEQFRGGVEKWKREREQLFEENNWQLLFFNESQVNEEYIYKNIVR